MAKMCTYTYDNNTYEQLTIHEPKKRKRLMFSIIDAKSIYVYNSKHKMIGE